MESIKPQKTTGPIEQDTLDYKIIEQAIEFIEKNQEDQPSLSCIASAVNLSEFHFQKLFSRWVGISPKRFLQFLTKEYAKALLDKSKSVLDTAYDSGLSSPGRLHDLFIHCDAVSPGEYKSKGKGISIIYGFCPSPFGECMIASTQRGICGLKFVRDNTKEEMVKWLENQWPMADLSLDEKEIFNIAPLVFPSSFHPDRTPLHLYVRGTNFQIKVWEALIRIPFARTVSYDDIAEFIKAPRANRAVGTAVGKNPVPYLIPCHRVIRKSGTFGRYGEGHIRKKALLGWEAAKHHLFTKALK